MGGGSFRTGTEIAERQVKAVVYAGRMAARKKWGTPAGDARSDLAMSTTTTTAGEPPSEETPSGIGAAAALDTPLGGASAAVAAAATLPDLGIVEAARSVFEDALEEAEEAVEDLTSLVGDASELIARDITVPLETVSDTGDAVADAVDIISRDLAPRTTAALKAVADSVNFTLDAEFTASGGILTNFFESNADNARIPRTAADIDPLLARGDLVYGNKMHILPKMKYTTLKNGMTQASVDYQSMVTVVAQTQQLSEEFVKKTMRYAVIESVTLTASNKQLVGKEFSSHSRVHVVDGKMNHTDGIKDFFVHAEMKGKSFVQRVISSVDSTSNDITEQEVFMFRGTAKEAARAIAGRFTVQRLSAALAAANAEAVKMGNLDLVATKNGRVPYYFPKNPSAELQQVADFVSSDRTAFWTDRVIADNGTVYYMEDAKKNYVGPQKLSNYIATKTLRYYENQNGLYAPVANDAPAIEYFVSHLGTNSAGKSSNRSDTTIAEVSLFTIWPVVAVNASVSA